MLRDRPCNRTPLPKVRSRLIVRSICRGGRWIDGCQCDRHNMGARSLARASGPANDQRALSGEAAVGVRHPVVRALSRHGAAWVVAIAEVGILTAGFPAIVVPMVLVGHRRARI